MPKSEMPTGKRDGDWTWVRVIGKGNGGVRNPSLKPFKAFLNVGGLHVDGPMKTRAIRDALIQQRSHQFVFVAIPAAMP
jgi:hypothetical protein